jgi:hypothetical protein
MLLLLSSCSLLPVSDAARPSAAMAAAGAFAFVEHRAEGSRVAVLPSALSTSPTAVLPDGVAADAAVWSPRGQSLLVRTNGRLELVQLGAMPARRPLLAAPPGEPRARWFSPDGRRLAVPNPHALSIVALDGDAPALEQAWPAGQELVDLLWHPDGRRLVLLILHRGGKHSLVAFDAVRGAVQAEIAVDCEAILGWRKGQLLVMRSGPHGQQIGVLEAKGQFRLLRAAPADRVEIYVDYLPATDQLLFVLGTEDAGDALKWYLTGPALRGQRRWLSAFRRAEEIRFSGDGRWAVLIDRSRPELAGEPGGDVHLVETVTETSRLLLRARPDEVTYSRASIRAH